MNRKVAAQLVLLVGVLIGIRWIAPRLMRRTVTFVVRSAPCAARISVDIYRDGERLRGTTIAPGALGSGKGSASTDALTFETALRDGEYEARVSLECMNGDIRPGEARPIVISDESTLYLRAPSDCDCG